MRKRWLILFTLTFLVSLTPLCYAQTGFDLLDLPQNVADYFGIGLFAAELLVSFMFLLFPTVMIGFLMSKRSGASALYAVLIVDFVVMGFLVALGWLDYWIFLIVCLLVAVLMAGTLRDMITGK